MFTLPYLLQRKLIVVARQLLILVSYVWFEAFPVREGFLINMGIVQGNSVII